MSQMVSVVSLGARVEVDMTVGLNYFCFVESDELLH